LNTIIFGYSNTLPITPRGTELQNKNNKKQTLKYVVSVIAEGRESRILRDNNF